MRRCGGLLVLSTHIVIPPLFRALASELRNAIAFDFVALFLYDESRNRVELRVLEVMNGAGVVLPADLRSEETITWRIYRNQKTAVIADPSAETRFPPAQAVHRRTLAGSDSLSAVVAAQLRATRP
jgi:hypothetical protein